jgi:hypothetical protein
MSQYRTVAPASRRGPRGVAGQAFLEPAAHRRLAAADLLIPLVVGHGALAILFTPRGARDSAARLLPRRFAPYNGSVRIFQLVNWYAGNDWAMPNGDRRVFGLPCRFPARPSILADCCVQVHDFMRLFGARGAPKNFYPEFSRAAGNKRGGATLPGSRPFGAVEQSRTRLVDRSVQPSS